MCTNVAVYLDFFRISEASGPAHCACEAVAHSTGRAQRAVGVEAALGAGVALALGA